VPDDIVIESARQLIGARFTNTSPILPRNETLHDFLLTRLGARDHEVFAVILLDVADRLIEYVELFRGDIAGAPAYPREVLKWVIATRATAVLVAHNHPSRCANPSYNDIATTRRLNEVLGCINVALRNHLIVGDTIVSLRDRGVF